MKLVSLSFLWLVSLCFLLAACAPTPEGNVVGYLGEQQVGGGKIALVAVAAGSIQGEVWMEGGPAAGVRTLNDAIARAGGA